MFKYYKGISSSEIISFDVASVDLAILLEKRGQGFEGLLVIKIFHVDFELRLNGWLKKQLVRLLFNQLSLFSYV